MKYLHVIVLLSIIFTFEAKAIIFGDENAINEGRGQPPNGCQHLNIAKMIGSQSRAGSAVYFEDPKGRVWGVTSAHSLTPKDGETVCIVLGAPRVETINGRNMTFVDAAPLGTYERHPSYDTTKPFEEQVQYDMGCFSLKRKQSCRIQQKFSSPIYDVPLNPDQEYEVIISSWGPSFDNQVTSYQKSGYHEGRTRITYNAAGYFTQTITNKDFYFLVYKNAEGALDWVCNVLPAPGEVSSTEGDSGGVVRTLDGKALAISEGTSWEEFYKNNPLLAQHIKDFREEEGEEMEKKLLEKVHAGIAIESQTKKLGLEDGRVLYRFTLEEGFPLITATNYFTPLPTHKAFMDQFIQKHKWQTTPALPMSNTYLKFKPLLKVFSEKASQHFSLAANFLLLSLNAGHMNEDQVNELEQAQINLERKHTLNQDITEETERVNTIKGSIDSNNLFNKLEQARINLKVKRLFNQDATEEKNAYDMALRVLEDEINRGCLLAKALDKKDSHQDVISWWNREKNRIKEATFEPTPEEEKLLTKLEELDKDSKEDVVKLYELYPSILGSLPKEYRDHAQNTGMSGAQD